MSTTNQIKVWKDLKAKCWMSETITNGVADAFLIQHMGTNILPTAFTEEATLEMVINALKARKPTYEIKGVN